MLGVLGQIGGNVVAAWIAVGIAGERQARQAAVASRRKQLQRVPPRAPGARRLLPRLEDRELATLLSQEMPDRKTRLAAADDDHVQVMTQRGGPWCRLSFVRLSHRCSSRENRRRTDAALEGRSRGGSAATALTRVALAALVAVSVEADRAERFSVPANPEPSTNRGSRS